MAREVHALATFPTATQPASQKAGSQKPDSQYRYGWHEQQQRAVPVAIDTPPTEPQVVQANHYVPYETSDFRNAYAWAASQVARKLPASVEMLNTLDSLIDQQMNARASSE